MKRSIATCAMLLALCLVPNAQATYDPVGSGQTKLILDKGLLSLLKSQEVKLSAKAPAKLKAGTLTLPVAGGEFDPISGKGTLEHEGVLIFTSAKGKVPLKAITLKAKKTPLQAKVGGSQLKLAKAKQIDSKREGFGEGFTAKGLTLTQKLATRLNKKLGLGRLLSEGQPFGRLTAKAQPTAVEILPQGQATFVPDAAFRAKLDSLFVSVNPIFPAEAGGGAFSFPIAREGAIAPDASLGTLKLAGELEFLQLGAGQVFWREPWLELAARTATSELEIQPTPAFPGALGRLPTLGLSYSPANVTSDSGARSISLQGAQLALGAEAARAFNEAFAKGQPVFAAGEGLGALSFAAVGR